MIFFLKNKQKNKEKIDERQTMKMTMFIYFISFLQEKAKKNSFWKVADFPRPCKIPLNSQISTSGAIFGVVQKQTKLLIFL